MHNYMNNGLITHNSNNIRTDMAAITTRSKKWTINSEEHYRIKNKSLTMWETSLQRTNNGFQRATNQQRTEPSTANQRNACSCHHFTDIKVILGGLKNSNNYMDNLRCRVPRHGTGSLSNYGLSMGKFVKKNSKHVCWLPVPLRTLFNRCCINLHIHSFIRHNGNIMYNPRLRMIRAMRGNIYLK